ncbi:hypothetical protein Vafri_1530 [Volvox africanus]|nr:hypothetical protein Vafri_1530 [Volvox africanus]
MRRSGLDSAAAASPGGSASWRTSSGSCNSACELRYGLVGRAAHTPLSVVGPGAETPSLPLQQRSCNRTPRSPSRMDLVTGDTARRAELEPAAATAAVAALVTACCSTAAINCRIAALRPESACASCPRC